MNNIKVLKKGIDVSKIKAQLDENPGIGDLRKD